MPTLSVLYVIRNEEKCLRRSMESIYGIADEIIIVDTGSCDKSLQICRQFHKTKIFNHTWVHDYSKTKNHGINQCTKEWILSIDADELLDEASASAIKGAICAAKHNVHGFALHIVDHEEDWGPLSPKNETPFFKSPQVRVFRRAPGVRFEGRVSESVGPSIARKQGGIDVLNARIHHHLWHGKGPDYALLKLRYYNKLGGQFAVPVGRGQKQPKPEAPPAPKVAIAIAAFNALNNTKKCISSISKNTGASYEFYFLDNGSTDGTANFFRQATGREPLRNPRNTGVAKGRNKITKEILKDPYVKYVCYLDNDTQVAEGWLEEMVSILESNPEVAMVGPMTSSASGAQKVHNYESFKSWLKDKGGSDNNFFKVKEIDRFCMLVRAEVLGKVGLFDDSFGVYGYEEVDFCRRVKEAGYDIAVANKVFVEHVGAATIRANHLNWSRILEASSSRYNNKWREDRAAVKSPAGAPKSVMSSRSIEARASTRFTHPRASIVLITHNRLDVTQKCIKSILDHTVGYELIVVDNGSTDGTVEWLENLRRATVIRNKENLGVPKARNQGIRATRHEYIVIMDNDVVVKGGWLDELFWEMKSGADVVGIEAWKLNEDWAASSRCVNQNQEFSYLGGACCLFRREVFEKVGLLDEGFSPAYYEDSISGERLVPVRYGNQVDVVPIRELFEMGVAIKRDDGKEQSYLPDVQTLSIDPDHPCPELHIDSLPEWWLLRNLSEKELACYRYRQERKCSWAEAERATGISQGYLPYRIRNKIRRSQKEDAQPRWVPIKHVVKHKNSKKMVRLTSKRGHTVCTTDHSVMSWNDSHLEPTSNFANATPCQANLQVDTPEHTSLSINIPYCDLGENEWYRFENPKGNDYYFPRFLDYVSAEDTAEALFFYLGLYTAEGSISSGATISMFCEKTIMKAASAAEKMIRRPIKIYRYNLDQNKTKVISGKCFKPRSKCYFRFTIGNRVISKWIRDKCGKDCRNKKIPSFVFTSPVSLKKAYLKGLLTGDGHLFCDSVSRHASHYSDKYKEKAFKFGTTSLRLASGLCLLLSSLGERYSVGYDDEKGEYKVNYVHIRQNGNSTAFMVKPASATKYAYDITIDGTHTFVDTCGMLALHNTDICIRAANAGLKLKWKPTSKIKHKEHSTLVHGQKSFDYRQQLQRSHMRFAQKMKGEIEVEHETLPPLDKKLKILYLGMEYDYGVRERGPSFEHDNFFPALQEWDKAQEIVHFDFVDIGKRQGIPKMSSLLLETVDKEMPDAIFAVFFDDHHDPRKEVIRRVTEHTPVTTIGWFCDSHWRYTNFDRRWADNLNYCVTTSTLALEKYKRDGLGGKVIKSQWGASPKYKRIPGTEKDIDVSFVGQPHGDRRQVVSQIQNAGIMIQFYGTGWGRRLTFGQMVAMFNRSKVNLNLNNSCDAKFKQIKGRNFEVPACGGFLLTGKAENLGEYYEYGKEIVTFDSTKDLIDKTKYYLAHDEEREQIALAGYERTMRDHTYSQRFDDIFKRAGLL